MGGNGCWVFTIHCAQFKIIKYLANIEALHTFKHRYDRVVSPVEGLPREDVVRECESFGIELPKAWAEEKKARGMERREAEKAGDIVGH